MRIELNDLMKGDAWTIALWDILEVKEWLTAPEHNLLTLFDADDQPIVKISKSGDIFVYEQGKVTRLECFDALYWVRGSREHLALTWDAAGSGVASPKGMLRAFWKAQPYASLAIDLDRQPVALEIGQPMAGIGVDELYVLDQALSLRSIWELMRHEGQDVAELEKKLAERETIEAARPTAVCSAAWEKLAREGVIVEAESNAGRHKVIISPTPAPNQSGRASGSNNNASTASGRACVAPGAGTLTFKVNVSQAGRYALAVRYCLQRRMHPLWPQNSTARTPWTENLSEVEVLLDGKPVVAKSRHAKLFPTGVYAGHRGDVEMWAWQALGGGRQVPLEAGEHTVAITFTKGLAQPIYDALLLSKEPGPPPPHPRWADQYRIPPVWWVADKKTSFTGGKRLDTYIVTLRNRCDEPCRCEIIADDENLRQQQVRASVNRIALRPFEEKSFQVIFEANARLKNNSGWANIYLWNEEVALRQKYRLWNLIAPDSAQTTRHPVLVEASDVKWQTAFREWLKQRDPQAWTPQLQQWVRARNVGISEGASPVRGFPQPLTGDRLVALDAWMKMSGQEIKQYLPDGPAEFNG